MLSTGLLLAPTRSIARKLLVELAARPVSQMVDLIDQSHERRICRIA